MQNSVFQCLGVPALVLFLVSCSAPSSGPALAQKAPHDATKATIKANAALLKELPFDNTKAFEDAKRGMIAPLPTTVLKGPSGNVIWDPNKYGFIKLDSDAPDTVNPSLWRQSQLINISGLFKVVDRLYQVRNYDLSNMTIVEGDTGLIIMDPLVSAETAKAALDLYYQHRPKKPVVAVIHTHSHVDHYGGVRGIVDEADVKAGKVKIFAPINFLEKAVSENVMAGTAMSRRASYMYGNLLPPSPTGQVGAGLGTTTSAGTITVIPPTDIVTHTGQKETIDGLTFEFLYAPGTEAPTEMHYFIEELKALTTAENACFTMHNTYSIRGTHIRDPLAWTTYLNETLIDWGRKAEVLYGMHHWPSWGQDVVPHLETQRDLYRYINDETLRLANHGFTLNEIAEQIELPDSLGRVWSTRGYYGTLYHNVKATYVNYLGWYDGNPATLHALPPVEAGKKYVEYMGGADAVLGRARKAFDKGDYRWVAQVVNHVVFADPDNTEAKMLQADALEQMGYQAESGPWRNFYLTGAQELRHGVAPLPTPVTASPDTVAAMSLELFFNYMGVRLNGPKAAGKKITLNWVFSDTGNKVGTEMVNGVLNHSVGETLSSADATITLTRATLNDIALKKTTLEASVKSGDIKVQGDEAKLLELESLLDDFEFWFNIVTP